MIENQLAMSQPAWMTELPIRRTGVVTPLVVLSLFALLAISVAGLYKYYYPYGSRTCFLPCMLTALRLYETDHNGNYPTGENPAQALSLLNDERYLAGSTDMLAGITGNRSRVQILLNAGEPLGTNDTSWVYHLGLRSSDDPGIAIIWERASGVGSDGMRTPGRAVGFIGGYRRQIPDEDWDSFIREQEQLRRDAGLFR